MNTQTPPRTLAQANDKPLSQAEARNVAEWLREQDFPIKSSGSLWKLRPSAISNSFKVPVSDILKAARRIEE